MAEIIIPEIYTRESNTDHNGRKVPVSLTKKFSYGTAGFRANATYLPFIVFRVGYLAGIRARYLNQTIGVMITASHNPMEDNGVKIIDPMGGMLDAAWENYADLIVNSSDSEFLRKSQEFLRQFSGRVVENATVFTAIDTRPSSKYIEEAAFCGAQCARVVGRRLGLLTTPQLHYIVRCQNDSSYGVPTEAGYYAKVQNALAGLNFVTRCGKAYIPTLYLDCANGIGAQKFPLMCIRWSVLVVNLMNDQKTQLNDKCGADYVKIEKKFPRNFDKIQAFERCAAFDGDADRLVYFYRDASNEFVLIDGDKIAALFAKYITEQVTGAGFSDVFMVSVIQTGYANGNSTKFLRDKMGVHVCCVATGIKNLQKEAVKYDIAVYFEANGHGTVYFSPRFYDILRTVITHKDEVDQTIQIKRLLYFSKLLNTVVGDAMTDLLAVEMILKHYDWTVENWNNMYKDLPNVQRKLRAVNRSVFQMSADETTCVKPRKLQGAINTIVSKYTDGRSFVRPSGTEDVVRIYAEAATEHDAEAIANEVEVAVATYCV
ncbi:Phosphoglucomutase/phosphomannomutase alpha/beta/alpha domain I family protein [Brugia pahangi]